MNTVAKTVAIYMPYAIWTPHFETDLELALKHLKANDSVHVVQCRGELPACEPRENQFSGICGYCSSRSDNGLNLVGVPSANRHALDLKRFHLELSLPEFRSIQELIDFKYEDADIGECVASSLITQLREHEPDMVRYQARIRRDILNSIAIYRYFLWLLGELKPDTFYLFNGRFASTRPALRAAQKLGIETWTHERAGMPGKYILIKGTVPQDLKWMKEQLLYHWDHVAPPQGRTKDEVSEEWFSERRGGKDQGWSSYTKTQQMGLLPKGFDPTKRNIVIFNSSEDELSAFASWKNPVYQDQSAAIKAIVESPWSSEFHFWLRMHPNLIGLDNTQTKQMYRLAEQFKSVLTVIRPEEAADTYHLMSACEKVIAFGSTTGLEATHWGKPSILLGRAPYEDLGCCYMPKSHHEAVSLIQEKLEPKKRETTFKFGYWLKSNGSPYLGFEWDSLFTGRFLGKEIKGSLLSRIGLKLSRHLGYLKFTR